MSRLTNAEVNKKLNQLVRKKRRSKQFLVDFEKGFIHGFMWCMGELGPYSHNLQKVIEASHALCAANDVKLARKIRRKQAERAFKDGKRFTVLKEEQRKNAANTTTY